MRKLDPRAVSPGVRAAIAAGLTAGLSFAIIVTSQNNTVRVETASDASAPSEDPAGAETTTTTDAEAQVTTTSPAPIEERVTIVERRVDVLEQTTTTTLPKPTTPSIQFYFEQPATNFGRDASQWAIVFRPSAATGGGLLPADFPNLHVRATVTTLDGPREFTAEVTLSSPDVNGVQRVGNIIAFVDRAVLDPALAADVFGSRTTPLYLQAATAEWDGGSQPVLGCC